MFERAQTHPLFYPSVTSYVFARSLLYSLEGLVIPTINAAVTHQRPELPIDDPELFRASRLALQDILRRDVMNIKNGLYPVNVLRPENPVRHFWRFPSLFKQGIEIARRRKTHKAHEFSKEAQDLLTDVPDYYRRNFHYQGDGYLSGESAELYDHQVEVLFAGAADAMRRLILPPLRRAFGRGDGEGLTFLEVGAGTGRATTFVRLAYPKAKIVAVDLSAPYLKKAQERLHAYARHDFVEADAAKLPFRDETFDAVYSVFLFHELPQDERAAVVREGLRVLKPGGFYGLVDSLQKGDRPELDRALKRFPKQFHEPFYANYLRHPMEDLLNSEGLHKIESDTGFFSKVVTAVK